METIVLSGIDLLSVQLLDSGNAYKEKKADGTDSKMAGQTFSRFIYNNKVFIVNDKSEFVADFKAGAVKRLTLTPSTMQVLDADGKPTADTASTIQFASHVTNTQWLAFKKAERSESLDEAMFDSKLSTIRSLDFTKVDKALLDLLEVEA